MSEEYTSVRVANVSKEANESIISSFFSFCGEIVSIDIHDGESPDTNEVIIAFETHDAAKMAEVLSNTAFLDNTIVITPYFEGDQNGDAVASSPEENDSAEPSENAPHDESPKPAEEKTDSNNNDDDDDDDDDDGKDEAVTKSTPSNDASETNPESTQAETPKETTANNDDGGGDDKKDVKDSQNSGENDSTDEGSVVHVNKFYSK